jgi:hypothetical protein
LMRSLRSASAIEKVLLPYTSYCLIEDISMAEEHHGPTGQRVFGFSPDVNRGGP